MGNHFGVPSREDAVKKGLVAAVPYGKLSTIASKATLSIHYLKISPPLTLPVHIIWMHTALL